MLHTIFGKVPERWNRISWGGVVLGAQFVPMPQIPGFFGRFPAPSGKRPKNPGIGGSA